MGNNRVIEYVGKINTHIADHNVDYSTKENGQNEYTNGYNKWI